MNDEEMAAYAKEWGEKHPCPGCGGPTMWDWDCPGWGKDPVMVCMSCGSANYYYCAGEKRCGWWWREPNNRSTAEWNAQFQRNVEMGPEPEWLAAAEQELTIGFNDGEDEV